MFSENMRLAMVALGVINNGIPDKDKDALYLREQELAKTKTAEWMCLNAPSAYRMVVKNLTKEQKLIVAQTLDSWTT